MKILVDQLPATPAECPFVTWNCEYGYICRFKRGALRNRETIFCKDTDNCPWLKSLEEKDQDIQKSLCRIGMRKARHEKGFSALRQLQSPTIMPDRCGIGFFQMRKRDRDQDVQSVCAS